MRHDFTNSTSLRYADYDEAEKVLTVCFASGKEYMYEDVPKDIYQNLIDANSAGKYFQSVIKPKYKVIAIE